MKKYILGFVTDICFLPILDSITGLVQTAIEVPKGILSKKVIKLNSEITELQEQSEPVSSNCIGFEIPSSEEYYGDEDDDDF